MSEGNDEDPATVTLPWTERNEREFKDVAATATIALLLILGAGASLRALLGAEGDQLAGAVAGFGLAVVGWFVWYGPLGKLTGSVVSVDHDGMWIRHRGWRLWPGGSRIQLAKPKHLPAGEIGRAESVEGRRRAELWRKSMALRHEGRLVGWTRNTVDRDTVTAALIEQTAVGLPRPWWLVRCAQSDELVRALGVAAETAESADAE